MAFDRFFRLLLLPPLKILLLAFIFGGCGRRPHGVADAADTTTGDPSMMEFWKVTLGLKQSRATPTSPTPLKVISAGLPRTGTASFVVALSKLGLTTYHMKDGAVETPGHLDLWYGLYSGDKTTANSQQTAKADDDSSAVVSIDDILDDMAVKGFDATSDGPACFWYKEQMERYPDAKIVLTVRGDGNGEAWAKSFETAIIDVMSIMREIPFRWIPMFQKIELIVQEMLKQSRFAADTNPDNMYPVVDQLPAAYDRWVEEVKATVGQNRLLIHAPKDGWEPLCEFLSPISSEVASKCDAILASHEPYPNVNDKAKVQAMLIGLQTLSTVCRLSPILFFVIACSMAVFGWKMPGTKSKPE